MPYGCRTHVIIYLACDTMKHLGLIWLLYVTISLAVNYTFCPSNSENQTMIDGGFRDAECWEAERI